MSHWSNRLLRAEILATTATHSYRRRKHRGGWGLTTGLFLAVLALLYFGSRMV